MISRKLPPMNVPVTDRDGKISPVWYEFFRMFVSSAVINTGGANSNAGDNVVAGAGLVTVDDEDAPNDLVLAVGAGNGITVNANDVNVDIANLSVGTLDAGDELMYSDASDNNSLKKIRISELSNAVSSPIGGSNTHVQYNQAGTFGGDSGFTYNGAGSADLSVGLNASTIQIGLNEQGAETIRFNDVTGAAPARIQADGSGGYTFHTKASGTTEARVYFSGNAPTILYTVGANTGTITISSTEGMLLSGTTMPLRRGLSASVTTSSAAQGDVPLTSDYNNVITVTNNNDAVTLPAALAGRYCLVRNSASTNTLTVYPASGDDLGFGVNVATKIKPGAQFTWFASDTTNWYQQEGLIRQTVTSGITASTTQTQGQQPLTTDVNEVSTVANANDVVTMPTATSYSRTITIINNGANTLQIFPASGDNLGAGVDTSVTLASGSNVRYTNYNTTNWEAI